MINKKKIIFFTIGFIAIILIGLGIIIIFSNPNRLNAKEKRWIKNNQGELIDIRVLNDVNTFGIDGQGVFYDYLNDVKNTYELDLNIIPYAYGAISPGVSFKIGNTITPNDVVLYKDHYVVVSKVEQVINNLSDLNGKKVGILNTDLTYVSYYFSRDLVTFEQFNNLSSLFGSLTTLDYIIVPLNQSLELILSNKYEINYHLSDIIQYYYLSFENKSELNSIMTKHHNEWSKTKWDDSYYKNLLSTFVKGLGFSEADLHSLTSKEYTYGSVENAPYEILSNNHLGGVVGEYLNGFIKMSQTDFNYRKYNSYDNLNKVANSNKLDLYFGYVDLANKFKKLNTGMDIEFDVITKNTNPLVVNSLESLKGKTVYILNNTDLYRYFNALNLVTLKSYNNPQEIFNLVNKEENIIVLDSLVYNYYYNIKLKNVVSKYQGEVESTSLNFGSNGNEKFNLLFGNYIKSVDNNVLRDTGVNSFNKALNTSSLIGTIIKYFIYIVLSGLLIALIIYRLTRRIKLSRRVKKEDKIRFIDLMTSLKNRNYLNENLPKWNQNNIYPQAIVIIDLNNVKLINDTYGREEGDRQIKAAANILIKTQLDNTEIVRTDGNEFLVYMIEYSEKQVSSYIHKLSKEFSNLPYEYGAALGYSLIENDLKLVDDAINEATLDMRTNKISGVSNVEKA